MRFSWTSLILAPLLVPVIFSTAMMILVGGDTLRAFLTFLVVACVVSYGTTIFLFLPCLFLLSQTRPMTGFKACLLGLVLGEVIFAALALIAWASAGPDIPMGNFLVFFFRWAADPVTAMFPLSGLMTAGLYWWLGRQRIPRLARSATS